MYNNFMKNCKFLKSVAKVEDILDDKLFEVAFVGRSNVGKSSLINAIFNTTRTDLNRFIQI